MRRSLAWGGRGPRLPLPALSSTPPPSLHPRLCGGGGREMRRVPCGKLCAREAQCVRVRVECTRVCAPACARGSVCTLACLPGYARAYLGGPDPRLRLLQACGGRRVDCALCVHNSAPMCTEMCARVGDVSCVAWVEGALRTGGSAHLYARVGVQRGVWLFPVHRACPRVCLAVCT